MAAAQRRGGQLADAGKHLRGSGGASVLVIAQLILDHMNSAYVSVAVLGVHKPTPANICAGAMKHISA